MYNDFDVSISIGIKNFFNAGNNPFFDNFFKIITQLGDVYFFLFMAILFYWFIDTKNAFSLIFAYLSNLFIVSILKNQFKRLRPYKQKNINIQSIGSKTSGYSFPSGHSNNISTINTFLNIKYFKNVFIWIYSITTLILIPFSRIYLGQHYFTDVLSGLILGIILTSIIVYILSKINFEHYIALILSISIFIFVILNKYLFNIITFDKHIYQACGGFLGFAIGYFINKKYIKYNPISNFKNNIFKLLIGIVPTILLYLTKYILPTDNIYNVLRYFLIAIWISLFSLIIFKKIIKEKKLFYKKGI